MIHELYACLYVREFPAQALLRNRSDVIDAPCAVLDGAPPQQFVCSLNTRARLLGIRQGMTRVELDTFPACHKLDRSKQQEAAAKSDTYDVISRFSPRVEDRSSDTVVVLALDIAGTEKLFGPPKQLAQKLLGEVRSQHISAHVVVSENLHAAICVARAGTVSRPIRIIPHGGEAAALSPLPLTALDLSSRQAETLESWGIHTLGALAKLPEQELVSRMGQDAKRLLQLARGERAHLFQPGETPLSLEEQQTLETPIELLEPLLFVVAVLLDRLIVRARESVLALSSVSITLLLDGGGTHSRAVKPALPSLDKHFLLKLLHLDLEMHPPQKAILKVILKAEAGAQSRVQGGLFSPPLPEPSRLDVTMARIRKIVGEENVGSPVLHDSHAPDSFGMGAFSPASAKRARLNAPSPLSVLRVLRPSETVRVQLQRSRPYIVHFRSERYIVGSAYGPWAADGGWWGEGGWDFEQWDIIAQRLDGTWLYGCLACESCCQQWRMVALYD